MAKVKTETQKAMKKMAREYTKLNAKIKELEDMKKVLAGQMKEILDTEEVDTMCIDEYTVRNKVVDGSRFDSTALKKNALDIYNLYSVPTHTKRFTVDYTAPKTEG